MDIWGIGCVIFEVLTLSPLFPGKNEKDQIERIHRIMGTPSDEVLTKFRKFSKHMKLKFSPVKGSGIRKKLSHCSADCVDLIEQMLAYDPEDRISAKHALRHPWFADLRARDKKKRKQSSSRREADAESRRSESKTDGGGAASQASGAKASAQKASGVSQSVDIVAGEAIRRGEKSKDRSKEGASRKPSKQSRRSQPPEGPMHVPKSSATSASPSTTSIGR